MAVDTGVCSRYMWNRKKTTHQQNKQTNIKIRGFLWSSTGKIVLFSRKTNHARIMEARTTMCISAYPVRAALTWWSDNLRLMQKLVAQAQPISKKKRQHRHEALSGIFESQIVRGSITFVGEIEL